MFRLTDERMGDRSMSMQTTVQPAARAEALRKVYGTGGAAVEALRGVSIEIAAAEWTAIMGPSGSGKSTLLHILAGLDSPTEGKVFIGDVDLTTLNDKQLTQLRRDKVGFVFQAFNLIPTLTAEENITLPLDIAGTRAGSRLVRHRGRHGRAARPARPPPLRALGRPAAAGRRRPGSRVASRRSSSPTSPRATSTHAAARSCWRSCERPSTTMGQTIVMVTHDAHAAAYADRVVFLADGNIVDELREPTADRILDRLKAMEA